MIDNYRLTTHEVLPQHIAAYIALVQGGKWCGPGPLGTPVGVWQPIVGQLSRLFFLHRDAPIEQAYAEGSAGAERSPDIQPVARTVQVLKAVKAVVLPADSAQLYELRVYTLFPGGLARYIPLLLDVLPAREKYSANVGIWTSITGSVDQLVHMWVYADANERANLRPIINADPDWQTFVPKILPLIQSMQSYFLSRVPVTAGAP